MPENNKPSVWIGCLGCYNEGRLVGEWYELSDAADVTVEDVHRAAQRSAGDHEELWVFDQENLPIEGECSPMDVAPWAEAYERLGDDLWSAYCAWEHSGENTSEDEGLEAFEDQYAGRWNSFSEYARDYAESIALLDGAPEIAVRYFNWASWISDLEVDHSTASAPGGGVYVFRSV